MTNDPNLSPEVVSLQQSLARLKERRRTHGDITLKEIKETEERLQLVTENARAMRARWAKLDEERQAKAQAEEAVAEEKRQKKFAAELAAFKERARLNFPGTASEFEAQWGQIKAEWQRKRALSGDDEIERMRAELRESGCYSQF